METVNVNIDGKQLVIPKESTVLVAARSGGIKIPHLCYMNLGEQNFKNDCASCRICVVEVEGRKNLAPACATPVFEGMIVRTNTMKVMDRRKTVLELLLSDHPKDCLICSKNGECELQELAMEFGIREIRYAGKESSHKQEISPSIIRDPNKCIMCRRCETMCNKIQTCGVLSGIGRGFQAVVSTGFNKNLGETPCTYCGQCVAVCPVGALHENDHTWELVQDLADPEKKVIVQVAPAVRVALGEEFGLPGQDVTKKMVSALKKIGFDMVFDTNFAADLTIMEEAAEFKERITKHLAGDKSVKLPILTSCCPAWVKFIEHNYPDMLDIPSTAKSPQQMFGAIAKNIWTKEEGIDKKNLISVSIMPCLAKKYEASRPEFSKDDIPDVDYSISTREIAKLLKQANINLADMEEENFDNPLGYSTGAADIFGRTGGVIEAATRTAFEWITGEKLEKVDFEQLRGLEAVRVAEIPVGNLKLRIGVAHGLGAARELLDKVRSGDLNLHAVEIMACKGGCIGGGGQPYHHGNFNVIKRRYEVLQGIDNKKELRKSHENPYVLELYKKYLEKPLSKISHELLHTHYYPKNKI